MQAILHTIRNEAKGAINTLSPLTKSPVMEVIMAKESLPHLCSIPGCTATGRLSRGMCSMHYSRWRRHGDPCKRILTKNAVCSVVGCGSSYEMSKGLCNKHYLRMVKHGDVHHTARTLAEGSTSAEKFWSLVDKRPGFGPHGDCWKWRASVGSHGYGSITLNGKDWLAHRYAYFLAHGQIDASLQVIHSCDDRQCVNPDHLRQGTHKENSQDAVERHRTAWGERNHRAKLTSDDVREIRRLLNKGELLGKEIAALFDVSPSRISDIRSGRSWGHL